MPTSTAIQLSKFQPISMARDHRGRLLIVNGLNQAYTYRSPLRDLINLAGVEEVTLGSFSGSWGTAGSISGVYTYAVRFKHTDGDFGNLSTTQTATASSHSTISYTNIPQPTGANTTGIQIFRSLAGVPSVLYLDAEVSTGTTSTTSTKSDATLSAQTRLPILNTDGTLHARRFGVPPADKAYVAAFKDRMWMAGDVYYNAGHVQANNGSAALVGVGTDFLSTFANRKIWFAFDEFDAQFTVATWTNATSIALDANFGGTTDYHMPYAIGPDPQNANKIYYSELLEPWSWPIAQNYLSLSDDQGDAITGLMPHGSYLYVLKERHIYRLSYGTVPAIDGEVYLVASRGCVNNRCWALVEDAAYLLDHYGVYAFNGGAVQPISLPIQDYFRDRKINWAASKWFHARADSREEVVRFFVALGASYLPNAALCFNYRLNRWWTEFYPLHLGGSCTSRINGQEVPLYGSEFLKTFTPGGSQDVLTDHSSRWRGTVTSAGYLSLVDSSVTFPSEAVNAPLAIVSGKGKGQVRRITSVSTSTLRIKQPWGEMPDSTSGYQIGGVPWNVKLGKFEWPQTDGQQTPRRSRVFFTPTKNAATLDVRRYASFNDEPENLMVDQKHGLLTTDNGSPDAVVDMKRDRTEGGVNSFNPGYQDVEFSETVSQLPGDKSMSLELRGVQGADPVRIGKITIEGVKR